jgi:2-desacetyl-2-hydroxyethyl bacteriochlorophyllide A dehydrogenase
MIAADRGPVKVRAVPACAVLQPEGRMKAKRLVFPSKLKVEIEDYDIPDAPGPDEVLIENVYGLISPGTELAMFTETHIGFPDPEFRYAKFPFRPGYAAIGRAVVVGKDVEGVEEGDVVYTGGHHTSHAVMSGDRAKRKVPEGIPLEHVPFVAMINISLTSVRLSAMRLGYTVAVFGQGMVGNFAAQLFREAGAIKTIGIDMVNERLGQSKECGIDVQINLAEEDLAERIREETDGKGCQVVVEATGNPIAADGALKSAAMMGEVILLGSPRGKAEVDLYFDIHRQGVRMIGAHGGRQRDAHEYGIPDSRDMIFELMRQGRLTVAPLHTHTLPAAQADEAFNGLLDKKEEYLGVILDLRNWG